MSEDVTASEIIIVRRRGHSHDDGHGSTAWKIAFADFMTAMMALFLVLWLTNATDLATKKQIATYFNPIELTDIQPMQKGMRSIDGDVIVDKEAEGEGSAAKSDESSSGTPAKSSDGGPENASHPRFSDPYDVIRRLSATAEPNGVGIGAAARQEHGGPAVDKGKAFRDPFDPIFRSETLALANNTANDPKLKRQESAPLAEAEKTDAAKPKKEQPQGLDNQLADASSAKLKQAQHNAVKQEAEFLADKISESLTGIRKSELPNVEVSVQPEGILISLTDRSNFEMFKTASAEPRARMRELMEKVGPVIGSMEGQIVVRGHTDGRPFRTTENDNWKLSMARAYSAYSTLIFAGVDKNRFDHIEGHADRRLKDKSDPNAAMNRRIEVLLRREPQ